MGSRADRMTEDLTAADCDTLSREAATFRRPFEHTLERLAALVGTEGAQPDDLHRVQFCRQVIRLTEALEALATLARPALEERDRRRDEARRAGRHS